MSKESKKIALAFQNVSKFDDCFDHLSNCNYSFSEGRSSIILGKEVEAKSALFRMAAGLEKPSMGDVLIFGKSALAEPSLCKTSVFYVSPDMRFHLPAVLSRLPDLLGKNFARWQTPIYLSWIRALDLPVKAMFSELDVQSQMRVLTALAVASGLPILLFDDVDTYLSNDEAIGVLKEISMLGAGPQLSTAIFASSHTTRWLSADIDLVTVTDKQIHTVSRELLREQLRSTKLRPFSARTAPRAYKDITSITAQEVTQTSTGFGSV